MNYEKAYSELIENRKNRELDPNEYYERHHIWPKSLAVDKEEERLLNQDWNLIYLTYKEHFITHQLLYKMTEGDDKRKMGYALWRMCWGNKNNKRSINSRQYEISRISFIESLSGKNHPLYGKNHSEETKQKMSEVKYNKNLNEETKQKLSEAKAGKSHPLYGKNHSEETKQKISEATSGKNRPLYGKNHSEETKKKISGSKKKQEQIKCPHCEKIGDKGNMERWHFDNCKHKKDVI